jgi:hypothetical protein
MHVQPCQEGVILLNASMQQKKKADMCLPVMLKINSFYMAATNIVISSRGPLLCAFSLFFV